MLEGKKKKRIKHLSLNRNAWTLLVLLRGEKKKGRLFFLAVTSKRKHAHFSKR